MRKLSQVDLSGLSPETILQNDQPAPPMETPGYSKAKAILELASKPKTAASQRHPGSPATLPQIERLLKKHVDEKDESAKNKRLAGYMLAGAGSGGFVGKTINLARNVANYHPPKPGASKLELAATIGGAIAGAAEAKRSAKKSTKTVTAGITPGKQLHDSKETGKFHQSTGESSGPTGPQQIRGRLMGQKFIRRDKVAMAMGSEELDQVRATVLTKEDTRAAADALFGDHAVEARRRERELVAKLFLQAPAAQTMAPMLQKEAVSREMVERVGKSVMEKIPHVLQKKERAKKFGRSMSNIMERAYASVPKSTDAATEHALRMADKAEEAGHIISGLARKGEEAVKAPSGKVIDYLKKMPKPELPKPKTPVVGGGFGGPKKKQSSAGDNTAFVTRDWKKRWKEDKDSTLSRGAMRFNRFVLDSDVYKAIPVALGATMGTITALQNHSPHVIEHALAGGALGGLMLHGAKALGTTAGKAVGKSVGLSDEQMEANQRYSRGYHPETGEDLLKSAGVEELAPRTVAFLEKNASILGLTEAQIRYPELLKVARREANAHQASPSIGKKEATPTSGPVPTQSLGSGGSA